MATPSMTASDVGNRPDTVRVDDAAALLHEPIFQAGVTSAAVEAHSSNPVTVTVVSDSK